MSPERPADGAVPPEQERWPIGRSIVERIKATANDENGPFASRDDSADLFKALYVGERDGCIPDELIGEDLLTDIHDLFYYALDGLRGELKERSGNGEFLWILVDPSWDDATSYALITEEDVLLVGHTKAWHFYWESEDAMAKDMEEWYRIAAPRLGIPTTNTGSPEGARGDLDSFHVTLRISRAMRVRAADPSDALLKAVDWESNENDPDVQLQYDLVRGHHIEQVEDEEDTS